MFSAGSVFNATQAFPYTSSVSPAYATTLTCVVKSVSNYLVKLPDLKSSHSIISIVPRLFPSVDGVGDYAYRLAQKMRQDFGIQTRFVVGDPNWNNAIYLDGFPVSRLDRCSAADLYSLIGQQPASNILLHYVGYGYAKRGCPFWLIDCLQQWQQSTSDTSLITMFHEIYAAGRPPWTSAFWLYPLQKHLATRLANLSKSLVTSKQLYANILHRLSPQHNSIPALPVFSTVGEPDKPPPLTARRKQLIVFGGIANRTQIYQSAMPLLQRTCRLLKIETVIDIGPKLLDMPEAVSDVPVVVMGQLTAAEISQYLLQATAGFLDYNPDYLAKSTIFAAYCSHGLLPINVRDSIDKVDGLLPGTHYLVANKSSEQQLDDLQIQLIADRAHAWYKTHDLFLQAKVFKQLCLTMNSQAGNHI
ncbi:MAG: glycosyltransferase family 1 protein [Cyanobacteria bacterium J06581_3]